MDGKVSQIDSTVENFTEALYCMLRHIANINTEIPQKEGACSPISEHEEAEGRYASRHYDGARQQ